jgi:TonB-dependent starch-binding outer membrane protein SusC
MLDRVTRKKLNPNHSIGAHLIQINAIQLVKLIFITKPNSMKRVLLFSVLSGWRCPTRLQVALLLAFLAGSASTAFSQVTVTGKVTDESGGSLPGTNVIIKGSTSGTTTNSDGDYTLQVTESATTLVFSFIGYETKEVAIGGQSVINVSLEPSLASLSEVVVIGYGEQRREAVTGSVASINGTALREVPSANISQALQGRLPGVDMTQTSSRPGAGMQIRIRGTRSLNTSNTSSQNDPLVVLDGIPFAGSINDIDPNSVKSIDILKDASATAIYGSRGANGVILVTTHRGQKGQPARLSYNSFYGVKNVFSEYPMMNRSQFTKLREEALRTVAELGRGQAYAGSADEQDNANTNWQDMLYRSARIMSHDLSLSKGSENGSYNIGVGYFYDEGVLPTNDFSRISLRAAVDQEVGQYIRFGLSSNNSFGVTQGGQVGIGDALGASPLASPYDTDGNLKRSTLASTQGDAYRVWTRGRIRALDDKWLSESRALASYNNIYGEVKIPGVEGLKYRMNLGLSVRSATGGSFTGVGVTHATNPNELSSASINNALTTNLAVENLLTYDRVFAGKHDVNVVALYSVQENKYNRSEIGARDFPADHFQYYNLGFGQGEVTINPDNQDYEVSGLVSWMGRVMYAYNDRYMLTATLRSDASSRLAPGHQWHTYPAVSVGWNMSEEPFMSAVGLIDMMKLRVGYGETSNQAVNPYATRGLLATRDYNFGDDGENSYETGYIITDLPNENLGWEFTETINVGLDFGLFGGRLNGTVEYYKQHTKDILLRVELPETAGVDSYVANIGESENKGIELSLNGVIIDNPSGFKWEAGVNFYVNRNKLVKLASGEKENKGNWWFVGKPINVIYDYKRVGLWQEEDPYLDILEPGGNVGMVKVKYTGGYDDDGKPLRQIGEDDRQVLPFDPDFQGGFNTRLSYKGFDLSMVGAFRKGGTLISTLYGGTSYLNLMSGRHNNVNVDYWTPEDTDAKYPRPGGATSGDNPKYANTLGYFDGSYLKVRTISLGYNFTKSTWMEKAHINQLRVYVTAQNPFVMFSPYHRESGMDPETNSYGNQNQAVTTQVQQRLPVVGTNTPSTRNYLIGLNLTF